MLNEISCDLVEALVGSDDLVVLAEQLIEQRRLIGIEFGLLYLLRDAAVEIKAGHAQLLPPILIDELNGGAVLF